MSLSWLVLSAAACLGATPLVVFLVLLIAISASAWWNLNVKMVPAIIRASLELLRMLLEVSVHEWKRSGAVWSFVDEVEEGVSRSGGRIQFIEAETGKRITLKAVDQLANQFANWGRGVLFLRQKDTICLMLQSCNEFASVWYGMGKIGVSTALLNTNISGGPLIHSVTLALKDSERKVLIIEDELASFLSKEILELSSEHGVTVLLWGTLLDAVCGPVSTASPSTPGREMRDQIKESHPILFVFTSGTTGLPKAARISSTRLLMMTMPARTMAYLKESQSRIYCCLPLYHSAGGLLGVGSALISGATLVIRKKFSVRNFTSDCLRYNCNSVQYIGELCRFLVVAPPNPDDQFLNLDYAFGNGMRPEVWTSFMDRYRVKRIVEFYSATEANVALFNSTGQVGAIGCVPRVIDFLYPVRLLRVDPDHMDTPLRQQNGLCILADIGEPGLAVNEIDERRAHKRFEGYSDITATGKKVLKDVLRKGDNFFNSGDLLRRDAFGFFYWCDRVGDTFRWKGENVATTEIELVLGALPFISDVCAYGVEVPNYDGRCGMVALTLNGTGPQSSADLDWSSFVSRCKGHLPAYAQPLFIRISGCALQTTGTFKHQKNLLVKAGFDPSRCGDDIVFFYNVKHGTINRVDDLLFEDIVNGKIKL